MMVLQMRSSGYSAEFRPFGLDPALLLPHDEDEPTSSGESLPDAQLPRAANTPKARAAMLGRLIRRLRSYWRSLTGSRP
jgi:hypothetical protein